MRLLFILIAYIFAEIALFSSIGGYIGTLQVLMLVVAGIFLGMFIIKRSGQNTVIWLKNAQLGNIGAGISSQIAQLVAGILFIIPGFLSDFLGLLILFPPTGKLLFSLVKLRTIPVSNFGTSPPSDPETIEGVVLESDRKPSP